MGATSALVATTALNLSNTFAQSEAIRAQGAVESSVAKSEARVARFRAKEAIRAGEKRVSILRGRREQTTGSQRAALAAQGIDPNSGTGAAVIAETRMFGDLDISETRNNAKLEALGFESEALSSEGRARFVELSTKAQRRMTLLTGANAIARDFALFGAASAANKPKKFVSRNPTEARFQKSFRKTGSATGGTFDPGVKNLGFAK